MTDASTTPDLAVAITTRDNLRTIGRTLDSVRGIARRVVVVDSGSTDGTIERCREAGAEIVPRAWAGHIAQKQFAIDLCRDHRWVLLLDSDESLETDLRAAIEHAVRTDDPARAGWQVNRKMWFLGGWLHHTFQPEWRLRLVRGGKARVVGLDPHDRLEVGGAVGRLRGDLRHDSWVDVQDMSSRHLAYARIAAETAPRGGSPLNLLFSPAGAMLKQLVLKGGFLDGGRGWIAAASTASATLAKHLFIAERRFQERGDRER